MFLWTMPMPPSWAMAMARRASVTVSMAADMSGILSRCARQAGARSTCRWARWQEWAGTSRTSSKVRASEALRDRLRDEGLFDAARKRPLPARVAHLAIITSPTGAALQDVLTVLARRDPLLAVTVLPAAVQGEQAAAQICAQLARANRMASDFDAVLLTRGGGSLEDLWAFNEEAIARAIAASGLPVVSAVGHETDVTIADFAADVRAPTPSAAAELLSGDQQELLARLAGHARSTWPGSRVLIMMWRPSKRMYSPIVRSLRMRATISRDAPTRSAMSCCVSFSAMYSVPSPRSSDRSMSTLATRPYTSCSARLFTSAVSLRTRDARLAISLREILGWARGPG
jgi:hypothetical protein